MIVAADINVENSPYNQFLNQKKQIILIRLESIQKEQYKAVSVLQKNSFLRTYKIKDTFNVDPITSFDDVKDNHLYNPNKIVTKQYLPFNCNQLNKSVENNKKGNSSSNYNGNDLKSNDNNKLNNNMGNSTASLIHKPNNKNKDCSNLNDISFNKINENVGNQIDFSKPIDETFIKKSKYRNAFLKKSEKESTTLEHSISLKNINNISYSVHTKGFIKPEILRKQNRLLIEKYKNDVDYFIIPSKVYFDHSTKLIKIRPQEKISKKEFFLQKELEFHNRSKIKSQLSLKLKSQESIDVTNNSDILFGSFFNSMVVDKLKEAEKPNSPLRKLILKESVKVVDPLYYDKLTNIYNKTFKDEKKQKEKPSKDESRSNRNFNLKN